jgi:hypothetical protein
VRIVRAAELVELPEPEPQDRFVLVHGPHLSERHTSLNRPALLV